ncbi:MAG TPA: type II toxin-antitoxin system VapC family toxin [Rhizomicrobium sp.]|jgi:predicted nucleic acid-binding protein|nr:type II toxin-antitoxin system VapC family toxin [Rhizomicrobium sp.]
MTAVLVDSNVLLDLFTKDRTWFDRSRDALERLANNHSLVINPIIYAEVSVHFASVEAVDEALLPAQFRREPIPFDAAFLAGKVFARYRKRGGSRIAPLPDFFIGAHAAVSGYKLLTRNARDYRRNYPGLEIVAP